MPNDLIPPALRVALRNAVGGWGPYSVREIHDLFNSHGFNERADDVEDAGGERRTTAERYHAQIDWSSPDQIRRYLDLVDEVLDNYPEEADEPDPVGIRLRRALRNAQIDRGPTGRLQLPEAEAETSAALDAATEGIWTPERIRVFLCHVSTHRHEVGELATELNRFAFSCFVAHAAIEPTRAWQEVIELALSTCDVLLAYVTPNFHQSEWTGQEVGWALGRGVVVVPLKVGADPYGFFGTYQALVVGENQRAWEVATAVVRAIAIAIFRQQRRGAGRLVEPMANAVVEAFCASRSFESTRRRFELLRLIPRATWTDSQVEKLRQAAVENSQIREAVLMGGMSVPEAVEALVAGVRRSASRPPRNPK